MNDLRDELGGELRGFLDAHPDIGAVQIFLTDLCGVLRGKSIRREELAALYTHGRPVAGTILGLDITGEDVDATGLVWEVGDADMLCRPVPGTLLRAPWLAAPTAQLMLSMYAADGSAAGADPRQALIRAVQRLTSMGYTPVLACELEFYLLREDAQGHLQPAGGGRLSERSKREPYSLTRLDDLAPLFDEIYAAAAVQGLPIETLMAEYAPGQFEITLRHRADALRAVDDAVLYKRLVRGVAARHGCTATFMAKPFAERAGSGLHLHLSLADAPGANLCAAAEASGSALLQQMIGGLRVTMAESMAIFAPNGNSYRRFQSNSYAPVAATWGVNNRSVSLRIPAGPPASRHVEHRLSGADANLYLAAATVLAAAEKGLRERLDPGPPVVGNGYLQGANPGAVGLPTTWQAALQAARESRFLRDALGEDTLRLFLAVKDQECAKFSAQVTELDYAWYLRA